MATLRQYTGPEGWEEDANLSEATRYAYRDASMYPDKMLEEWRNEINARLAGGAPYGKIVCWECKDEAMKEWRRALTDVPADAAPITVYGCAPADALSFIGW